MRGVFLGVFHPAGPGGAEGLARLKDRYKCLKGLLPRCGGLHEQAAARGEPVGDGRQTEFQLGPGKKVEDVGSVYGRKAVCGEAELAGEAAGDEYESGGVGGGDGAGNFGEMGGFEIVGDDSGSRVESGQRGEAESGANIEDRQGDGTAMGHEPLTNLIELVGGPSGLIACGDAAVHSPLLSNAAGRRPGSHHRGSRRRR